MSVCRDRATWAAGLAVMLGLAGCAGETSDGPSIPKAGSAPPPVVAEDLAKSTTKSDTPKDDIAREGGPGMGVGGGSAKAKGKGADAKKDAPAPAKKDAPAPEKKAEPTPEKKAEPAAAKGDLQLEAPKAAPK